MSERSEAEIGESSPGTVESDETMNQAAQRKQVGTGRPAGGGPVKGGAAQEDKTARGAKSAVRLSEHVVEVISDSGEGAQRCGQTFGSVAARMGKGVWTVEIIPAEIQPPARSAEELYEAGYNLVLADFDAALLRDGARARVAALRAASRNAS